MIYLKGQFCQLLQKYLLALSTTVETFTLALPIISNIFLRLSTLRDHFVGVDDMTTKIGSIMPTMNIPDHDVIFLIAIGSAP